MSPLRQEAFKLLETVPEEDLLSVIQIMQAQFKSLSREERLAQKQSAYEHLQELINSKKVDVPADFDCKKELAEYREERFDNANFA